jgi:2-hydroxychromene-2-carboxylate isomerase
VNRSGFGSPRIFIARAFARTLTGDRRRDLVRLAGTLRRKITGATATVHYFHDPQDPYSQLAATQLGALARRYHIVIRCHAVPPPRAAAAPAPAALLDWSQRDARCFARHFGLPPPANEPVDGLDDLSDAALLRGENLRHRLGHYLGATFFFEGEWYSGLDRLHYLESRLQQAGLARSTAPKADSALFAPPSLQWRRVTPEASARPPTLHFFCSLRSPYTYLAIDRVRRLARHYGATLRLDYVLPMVMRGLPVPWSKRRYILLDAKREATRLGLPFGDVVDPVGLPTERGLAVLQRAIDTGRGEEFLESFLRGVFAEGIDAGSMGGLEHLATRAGLTRGDVTSALADSRWRTHAEENRAALLAAGLWGVPSFKVDGFPAVWGQDRLWCVEQDLLTALAGEARPAGDVP